MANANAKDLPHLMQVSFFSLFYPYNTITFSSYHIFQNLKSQIH